MSRPTLFARPPWPFAVNRDSPQAQGLVAWWPGGVFGGGFPVDVLGRWSMAAALETPAVVADPLFGYAGSYTTGQLDVGAPPVTAVPLTLASWFYPGNTTADCNILLLYDADASDYFSLTLVGTASDRVRAGTVAGGAASIADSTTAYVANTWQHAGAVFAAANSRAAFLNGGGKATNTTSRTPAGLVNLGMGLFNVAGRLADTRVYSRALADGEMAAYFSDPRLSLELYYPLGRKTWSFPGG